MKTHIFTLCSMNNGKTRAIIDLLSMNYQILILKKKAVILKMYRIHLYVLSMIYLKSQII